MENIYNFNDFTVFWSHQLPCCWRNSFLRAFAYHVHFPGPGTTPCTPFPLADSCTIIPSGFRSQTLRDLLEHLILEPQTHPGHYLLILFFLTVFIT